jgi:hypothetical protein
LRDLQNQGLDGIVQLDIPSLHTLDISGIKDKNGDLMKILADERVPLTKLIIKNWNFKNNIALDSLIAFVKNAQKLKTLDISKSELDQEQIADLISAFSENSKNPKLSSPDKPRRYNLFLDELKINGVNSLPIIRAILLSDLKIWQSFSFNKNGLTQKDLQNLIPLFRRLPNLKKLSLAGNFKGEYSGIHKDLLQLSQIPHITSLDISGSEVCKLKDELQHFLAGLSHRSRLASLDISMNDGTDRCAPTIAAMFKRGLLHNRRKENETIISKPPEPGRPEPEILQKIKIDCNKFANIESFEQIITAAKDNKNIIDFPFPINDALALFNHPQNKSNMQHIGKILSDYQQQIVKMVQANRAAFKPKFNNLHSAVDPQADNQQDVIDQANNRNEKLPRMLPFPAEKYIRQKITSLMEFSTSDYDVHHLLRHTGVCVEFGLLLPFQNTNYVVSKGGTTETLANYDKMEIYQVDSMKTIIIESEDPILNIKKSSSIVPDKPNSQPITKTESETHDHTFQIGRSRQNDDSSTPPPPPPITRKKLKTIKQNNEIESSPPTSQHAEVDTSASKKAKNSLMLNMSLKVYKKETGQSSSESSGVSPPPIYKTPSSSLDYLSFRTKLIFLYESRQSKSQLP